MGSSYTDRLNIRSGLRYEPLPLEIDPMTQELQARFTRAICAGLDALEEYCLSKTDGVRSTKQEVLTHVATVLEERAAKLREMFKVDKAN